MSSICLTIVLSATLTFSRLASWSSHVERIRKPRTWSRNWSYCCWHWVLYCASVGSGWPLAGLAAVFFFSAMHCLKSGASGTVAVLAAAGFV